MLLDQSLNVILEPVDNIMGPHVKEINVCFLLKGLRKEENTPAV